MKIKLPPLMPIIAGSVGAVGVIVASAGTIQKGLEYKALHTYRAYLGE